MRYIGQSTDGTDRGDQETGSFVITGRDGSEADRAIALSCRFESDSRTLGEQAARLAEEQKEAELQGADVRAPGGVIAWARRNFAAISFIAVVGGLAVFLVGYEKGRDMSIDTPDNVPTDIKPTGNPKIDHALQCGHAQFEEFAGCKTPHGQWKDVNCDPALLGQMGGDIYDVRDFKDMLYKEAGTDPARWIRTGGGNSMPKCIIE